MNNLSQDSVASDTVAIKRQYLVRLVAMTERVEVGHADAINQLKGYVDAVADTYGISREAIERIELDE